MPNALTTKRLWALGLAVAIVCLDRLTKVYIQHVLSPFENVPVIPDLLRIVHVENPGAAFGVLAEGNPAFRALILIGVSFLVLCLVIAALWMRSVTEDSLINFLALGAILGGAGGNLYDRIVHGTVTDFIEVFHGSWSFPAFNVADSAITVGAAFLVLNTLFRPNQRNRKETLNALR
ncbi:MAG: signal peptidase II [Bryobacteraceae bacterium]